MAETKRPSGGPARGGRKKRGKPAPDSTAGAKETATQAAASSEAEPSARTREVAERVMEQSPRDESYDDDTREPENFEEEGADDGLRQVATAQGRPETPPRASRSDNRDNRGSAEDRGPQEHSERPAHPIDEYLIQVYFDKAGRHYVAMIFEFPELKATGPQRSVVVKDIESRLDNHLQNLRRRNEPAPEAFFNKRYPEKLEVRISQHLFRRLDFLSRAERMPIDQLVSELLSAAIERRTDKRPEQPARPPQHQHSHQPRRDRDRGGRDRDRGPHHDRENIGNQRHSNHSQSPQGGGRRGGPPRGRSYHDTMDNRENFLEYVRNLEKGGGWKKR